MVKYGKLFICDRCGRERFVPKNLYKDEYDHPEFEEPVDWMVGNNKNLCPTCTELYNKMLNNFFAPEVKRPINLED